jgi:hypothetical protein
MAADIQPQSDGKVEIVIFLYNLHKTAGNHGPAISDRPHIRAVRVVLARFSTQLGFLAPAHIAANWQQIERLPGDG